MRFAMTVFDPTTPDMRRILNDRETLHAVMAASMDGSTRPLWRLDGDRLYTLGEHVDTDRLKVRLHQPDCLTRIADYDRLLDRLRSGDRYRFSVDANPMTNSCRGTGRKPILNETERLNWLTHRFETGGCHIDHALIRETGTIRFTKPDGNRVTICHAVFEGVITIIDPEKTRRLLTAGVGRAKAYGYGMIMLSR